MPDEDGASPPEGLDQEETSQPAEDRPAETPPTETSPTPSQDVEAGGAEVHQGDAGAPTAGEAGGAEQAAPQAEAAAEPEPEPEPREPDPVRDPLLEALQSELGDALVGSAVERDDIWIRVDRSAWLRTGELLKERHGFDYFCFLSGIDWMANPELANRYEKVWDPEPEVDKGTSQEASSPAPESGIAGGETRFQVFARLYNIDKKLGITIKADLDSENPSVQSWVSLYRGADWHEREAWEMFGFDFEGHPSLRHLYLPTEFEGFPLRKDFPLLSRVVKPWPGLVDKEPIPGEDEGAEEGASA